MMLEYYIRASSAADSLHRQQEENRIINEKFTCEQKARDWQGGTVGSQEADDGTRAVVRRRSDASATQSKEADKT